MKRSECKRVREELVRFVDRFRQELGRSERRHWCGLYLSGLMLDGERKSIEPLARRLVGGNDQALQQFVNQSPWRFEGLQQALIAEMVARLDWKSGLLVLDDTTLPKKGEHSVGVSRQYCGALGKIANCQCVVTWHAVRPKAHFPLLGEIYLPQAWIDDRKRLKRVGVPKRRHAFQEKWRLALDLLDTIRSRVTHEALVFDAGYGNNRDFLKALDERQECFVGQISGSLCFWPAQTPIKRPTGLGRPRKHRLLVHPQTKPRSAAQWAKDLETQSPWTRLSLSLQTPKTLKACAIRVYESLATPYKRLGPERWLLIERLPDQTLRYSVSNLPVDTPLKRLVEISHSRWAIEQGYQQLKEELGLDHFEGRSWLGLHHHITLCFMAYDFLLLLRQGRKKTSRLSHFPLSEDGSMNSGSSRSARLASTPSDSNPTPSHGQT